MDKGRWCAFDSECEVDDLRKAMLSDSVMAGERGQLGMIPAADVLLKVVEGIKRWFRWLPSSLVGRVCMELKSAGFC